MKTELKNLNFVNGLASTNFSFDNVVILTALETTGWDNLHLVPYVDNSNNIWYIKDINGKNRDEISVYIAYIKRN